jgi:hypothetical protein
VAIEAAGSVADALTGEPSAAERAAALSALPLTGHADALGALSAALERGGVCVVRGPAGSGRTRVVREAVARVQAGRAQRGLPVPTYRRAARLPSDALGTDTLLHVEAADGIATSEAAAFVRAAELEGHALSLVLESSPQTPLPAGVATVIELAPLSEGELRRLVEHALPGTRVPPALMREAMAVSSGLSGRLCELLSELLRRGLDPGRPQSLRALGSEGSSTLPVIPGAARALVELLVVGGGERGRAAVQRLLDEAWERRLIPKAITAEFSA